MKNILIIVLLLKICLIKADIIELKKWELKSSTEVTIPDAQVTSSLFTPKDWFEVTVPTTVLNALVKQGVYPDPRSAMNNFLIPDVSDKFNKRLGLEQYSYLKSGKNPWKDPYWYRTEVVLPRQYRGKRIWLALDGINYRADVWVNGVRIADKNEVVGMFRRFKFDITEQAKAGEKNYIAIKIYQVDHPGDPDPGTQFVVFGPHRSATPEIFKDETLKMSAGWDCAPVVRDRNMGLYQKVALEVTDQVTLDDPYVITTLPKKDTTLAEIAIQTLIKNNSDKPVQGILKADIRLLNELVFPSYTRKLPGSMTPIHISKKIALAPNEEKEIILNADEFKALQLKDPYLWYPNGYGEQYLHHLDLTFQIEGKESDKESLDFGIREITTDMLRNGNEYGKEYYINGRKIFCKGGWIQPDILLEESTKRIYDEARLQAEANINIIASEDMPTPTNDWLESWDKYGLMNWHVFHQCWRMYPGTNTANFPLDHNLATACVKDMIKRYRNHPSIISWIGAVEVIMAEDLYRSTKKMVEQYDITRPYLPTTCISWDVEKLTPYLQADLPIGTTDDGAPDYGWAPSDYFFDKIEEVHLQMFRNELGMPSVPVYESLKKFIPTIEKKRQPSDPIYPLDSIWSEHGAWDNNNFCYRGYDSALRTLYGEPETAKEYSEKGQILSADGYRAMYEAANHRMGDITTGVMLWKLNSCWPDVCWQIYDWYLAPNASYYFSKKAMEPVHIQMNAHNFRLSVINATHEPLYEVVATARIIDNTMKEQWSFTETVSVPANQYKELTTIPRRGDLSTNYFIKLTLKNKQGKLLSENLYWQYSQHQSFSWLMSQPKTPVKQTVKVIQVGKEYKIEVTLKNNTKKLSFFNHLVLKQTDTKEAINPVFWSDNYISLFPGEEKTVTATVAVLDTGKKIPFVTIE